VNEIEQQWAFMLSHSEERVSALARRASEEPALRGLFPYNSLFNLRFSRKTQYPYDALPWVESRTPDTYWARGSDNRPLVAGDLDVVIAAVVEAIRAGK
jgi:hypothetical protein